VIHREHLKKHESPAQTAARKRFAAEAKRQGGKIRKGTKL